MIEEPVSDVEIRSDGASSEEAPLVDDGKIVIIIAELEEHTYSKVKLKLFEQRRTRHAQEPEPDVPPELLHGWRIVNYLMSGNCRSFCAPFLEKPEVSMREYWRNHSDSFRETPWLGIIKQKIVADKKQPKIKAYESIGEIVADLRRMLENVYLAFGPHHPISKKGIKLEQVLETKISLLPRDMRDRCSIDATRPTDVPRGRLKVEDGESMLIAIIRHERAVRGREQRSRAREERKFEREVLAAAADSWDLNEVRPLLVDVQLMWEVPHIAHFLFLAQHALGFPEFTMFEFERALLFPRASLMLHSLMTCLLTTGFKSVTSTASKPPMAYLEWNEKLRNKLVTFYKTFNNHGTSKVFEDTGVEDNFFRVVGATNPFDRPIDQDEWCTFENFSLRERVTIIKALCDQRLAKHKSVADYFVEGTYTGDDMRQVILGTDSSGREYFYFPCLCNHDLRIYSVQQFPHKQGHGDCYQVAIKRIPRSPKLMGKKRKKKIRESTPLFPEIKSRRKSAKLAARAMLLHDRRPESSDDSDCGDYDEEVIVYNSDGCPLMAHGELRHNSEFKLVAGSIAELRALIEQLKTEALMTAADSMSNIVKSEKNVHGNTSTESEGRDNDESTNDTHTPSNDDAHPIESSPTMEEYEEEDLLVNEGRFTNKCELETGLSTNEPAELSIGSRGNRRRSNSGRQSESGDSRSATSLQDFMDLDQSSQDATNSSELSAVAMPRRSLRMHKQTQRFAEMMEDEEASQQQHHLTLPTRRSARRMAIENGVDSNGQDSDYAIGRRTDASRIVSHNLRHSFDAKLVANNERERADRRQPSTKRLVTQLELLLDQFLPFESGFLSNESRMRLKLYTEVHHPHMLVEEQKQKADEDKLRRSKRMKDPWAASSQYMDEMVYGDAAFDGISDSDEETSSKSKKSQPTRRSNRHQLNHTFGQSSGTEDNIDHNQNKEWQCKDEEQL